MGLSVERQQPWEGGVLKSFSLNLGQGSTSRLVGHMVQCLSHILQPYNLGLACLKPKSLHMCGTC